MSLAEDLLEQDERIEQLEESIKENIEWLYTTDNDEIESISIENLEKILKIFFGKTIQLKNK